MRGAYVPALLRAVTACGWLGIQTWIGGYALYPMAVRQDLRRLALVPASAPPLIRLGLARVTADGLLSAGGLRQVLYLDPACIIPPF